MKKELIVLILLILLSFPIFVIGETTTDYGLHWAVSEGDRFDFHAKVNMPESLRQWWGLTAEYDEDVYILIAYLPEISEYDYYLGASIHWANGSFMDEDFPSLVGLPVGNWTHIQEITDPYDYYNYTLASSSWRIYRSASVDLGFLTYDFFAEYSRTDGILNRWYLRIVDGYGDEAGLVDVVRLRGNLNPLITLTIIGAAGVIVIFTVAIFIKKKQDSELK